jgi:N-acetylneuraminate synthase
VTSSREIKILDRRVGAGLPTYFIAEAGSNHDGDFDQAKRLIDVAADAGADAVKFQAFTAERLYPKSAGRSDYLGDARSIYDIIRSLEMPLDWIPALEAHCRARGIHFLCTPFDEKSADALTPHVPAFKLASYDMTNYPLLQHVARKGKPMIVSTGTANLGEVREMIAAVRAVADPGLVVLQCTAKYPAPLSALNVRTVATMAELGVLTGLSDHSREPLPGPLAAVALGAVVIEKHFTLSNRLAGPDHAYALEPHELKELVATIRQVESSLGTGEKVVQPEENELRAFARRSIFTTRPVAAGERLQRADLSLLRCGSLASGLHPRELVRVPGRVALRALEAEVAPTASDFGPLRLVERDVALRLPEPGDAPRLVAWRTGAHAPPFFALAEVPSDPLRWFEGLALHADRLELIVEAGTTGPVGVVGLGEIDFGGDQASFGVFVDTPAGDAQAGDAVAERAARLMLDHAFGALGLGALTLTLPERDADTRRLAERLGFRAASGGALVLSAEAWTKAGDRR